MCSWGTALAVLSHPPPSTCPPLPQPIHPYPSPTPASATCSSRTTPCTNRRWVICNRWIPKKHSSVNERSFVYTRLHFAAHPFFWPSGCAPRGVHRWDGKALEFATVLFVWQQHTLWSLKSLFSFPLLTPTYPCLFFSAHRHGLRPCFHRGPARHRSFLGIGTRLLTFFAGISLGSSCDSSCPQNTRAYGCW